MDAEALEVCEGVPLGLPLRVALAVPLRLGVTVGVPLAEGLAVPDRVAAAVGEALGATTGAAGSDPGPLPRVVAPACLGAASADATVTAPHVGRLDTGPTPLALAVRVSQAGAKPPAGCGVNTLHCWIPAGSIPAAAVAAEAPLNATLPGHAALKLREDAGT
jgi:hypothetical protein